MKSHHAWVSRNQLMTRLRNSAKRNLQAGTWERFKRHLDSGTSLGSRDKPLPPVDPFEVIHQA